MAKALLFSLLLIAPAALAQDGAVSSIESDQAEYAYGETIELRYSIANEGSEPFTLVGARVGCQAEFLFDGFDSRDSFNLCTTDDFFEFAPGETGTWTWQLRPGSLGLPETSGEHTVTGFWNHGGPDHLPATVTFVAPQYLGGRVFFGLAPNITLDDVQDVAEALNAVEVDVDPWTHVWEITGVTLTDAVAQYGNDARFEFFAPFRIVEYTEVVFTDDEDGAPPPSSPALTAAHPNPFATSTSFALTVPESGATRVEVFDLLGRRVAALYDGPLTAGPEHHFTFHAADLPSGLYVVRATGEGFVQTRRVTLSR